jgi:3-oxoadipate enol-lactonase
MRRTRSLRLKTDVPYAVGSAGPIHWLDAGTGAPLVLLHGLGGDAGFWAAEIDAWAPRHRLIAIDIRGSGATPASTAQPSMADLADDVAAVLDDAGLVSADVLGFSMGGNVAQALALRHPQRVRRLVLASTFARMNAQARLFLDAVLTGYERSGDAKQMFRLIYPWLFSIGFLTDPANDEFRQAGEDAPEDQTLEAWRALYLAQRRFDARPDIARIAAPTLVIGGAEDRLVAPADLQLLTDRISGAKLELLPNAGHLVNIEAPREFRGLVEQFLGVPPSREP